jgi:NADH:ubiquinone oxidoreductase subunit K
MLTLEHYLIVAATLFTIGVICVISRKNAIGILIGIELILNAANLNLIAFSRFTTLELDGQIFAIFVIILAACEAAVGLAIFINLFANIGTVDVDEAKRMKR